MSSAYLFKSPSKRFAATCFDFLGGKIYPRFAKKPDPYSPEKILRILVIRLDHIGDVVMTRPAIQALVAAFPNAKIDWMVSEELLPLLEFEPGIHRFYGVSRHWFNRNGSVLDSYQNFWKLVENLKREAYDLAIDFRGDLRNIFLMERASIPYRLSFSVTGGRFLLSHVGDYDSHLHQVDLNLKLLEKMGIQSTPTFLPLSHSPESKEKLKKRFDFLKSQNTSRVILHMGAGYPSKHWPVDSFRSLISKIIKLKEVQVILIGTKIEKNEMPIVEYPNRLFDLRGKLRLEELPVLMDLSDFYIGNDSGPAHLAAAQRIPGLILFSGANDSEVWRPRSEKLKVLTKKVSCSPCESPECPLKHHECMTLLTVEEVFAAFQERAVSAR